MSKEHKRNLNVEWSSKENGNNYKRTNNINNQHLVFEDHIGSMSKMKPFITTIVNYIG